MKKNLILGLALKWHLRVPELAAGGAIDLEVVHPKYSVKSFKANHQPALSLSRVIGSISFSLLHLVSVNSGKSISDVAMSVAIYFAHNKFLRFFCGK